LHVLSLPPAFVLSQDQTLRFDIRACLTVTLSQSKRRSSDEPKTQPGSLPTRPKAISFFSHETCPIRLVPRTSKPAKDKPALLVLSATPPSTSLFLLTLCSCQRTRQTAKARRPDHQLAPATLKHPSGTLRSRPTPNAEGAKPSRQTNPGRKPPKPTRSSTFRRTKPAPQCLVPSAPAPPPSSMSGL
jgi:hypothetical protein